MAKWKKDKRRNNDLQNITCKTKDRVAWILLKIGVNIKRYKWTIRCVLLKYFTFDAKYINNQINVLSPFIYMKNWYLVKMASINYFDVNRRKSLKNQ